MGVLAERVLGGPGQAAQNLLVGNPGAAIDAVTSPEELSPQERDAFLKKLGVEKSIFAPVFRMATNPAVVMSAVFSMKFPVATAANLFKASEEMAGYTSRFPILRGLASMHSWFRGTPIPDLFTQIGEKRMDFLSKYSSRLGSALDSFQEAAGHLPDSREQKLLGAWLDGLHKASPGVIGKYKTLENAVGAPLMPNLEAYMSKPLMTLAKTTRTILDDIGQDVYGNLQSRKEIIAAVARAKKAGFVNDELAHLVDWAEVGGLPADYYPRRLIKTEKEFMTYINAITGQGRSAGQLTAFGKRAAEKTRRVVGPQDYYREGAMMPSLDELKEIEDVLDPGVYATMKDRARGRILKYVEENVGPSAEQALRTLPYEDLVNRKVTDRLLDPEQQAAVDLVIKGQGPKQYSLKSLPTLNKYMNSISGTYAWTSSGLGNKVFGEVSTLRDMAFDARAKRRLFMLENTYIPMALGWGDMKQALKSQAWQQSMMRTAATLDTPAIRGLLGDGLHKQLTDTLTSDRSALSLVNLERRGAGLFYLSTLGGNPGSALKNLLQLVLTTGPAVGFRTASEGAFRALQKSKGYFEARFGSNLSHDEAIRKAFPEYAESGLAGTPLTDETLQNALRNSYEIGFRGLDKGAKVAEKVSRSLMAMFSASEHAVRLSTFEAGMLHAERGGLKGADALRFSRKLVEATQFLSGPQNQAYALTNLPQYAKQLLTFPFRMAEFATDTAFTLGSAEKSVMGLNPGTFSRAILGSAVAYELGNSVGLDLGDSLFTSAIPGATDRGPFAPFPLIPPAFQLVGAFGMDLASGDFEELRKSIPLLLPGGVGAAKVVGAIPGGDGVARFLGRSYADYEAPSPTGRIPVYTSEGQLKGFYSPWEVFTQAVGVRTGDRVKEEELLRTIVANRDEMRASKANFVQAILKNDPATAERTAHAFKERYGFDIPVSKKDVENAQLRRSIPRLANAIQTLPPGPLRQQYVQLIAETMGANSDAFLGQPPENFAKPGATRAAARSLPTQRSQISASYGVNPTQLSKEPPDSDGLSPF